MASQPNIISDIATLTRVPNKVLEELINKETLCIGSIIYEAKLNGQTTTSINIGLGTLNIDLIDMQCKFVPSKNLKTAIKNSLAAKTDPLELQLEDTLIEKLIRICNEVV